LLQGIRPGGTNYQQYNQTMMRNMQNGAMGMNLKPGNLQRAAMANNKYVPNAARDSLPVSPY